MVYAWPGGTCHRVMWRGWSGWKIEGARVLRQTLTRCLRTLLIRLRDIFDGRNHLLAGVEGGFGKECMEREGKQRPCEKVLAGAFEFAEAG